LGDEELVRRLVREELAAQVRESPSDLGAELAPWMTILRRGLATAERAAVWVLGLGLSLFLVAFYFYFFAVYYPAIIAFFDSLIPVRSKARAHELLGKMDRAVAGFVRGRVVISAIIGAILAIGWFICEVPYSIVLGIVVGIFNLVPYLSLLGLPIAIALLLFDQYSDPAGTRMSLLWIVAGPSIVFGIAQVLDGYVLTPLIAGKATDLDPVTILVAVLAGGSLAGVYGMLLAIPVAACLKILFREVMLPKVKAWTRGERADPLPMG
jgi:predicted PurR-regulated permease PerM